MLSIEVTTKCNLKCINCFAHDDGIKQSDISYETALEIIKEGRELGFYELSLTGGEPFLWKNLLKLMKEARGIGYTYFLINTNAHILNSDICRELKEYGDSLEISVTINGDKEEHDSVRGKGSYNLANKGVALALEYGLNIHIYSVVNRRNLPTLPYFASELFKRHKGIKSLVFIQLRGIDDEYYSVENLKLTPKELIEFVKMVSYLNLAGLPVYILENSLTMVVAKKLGLKWYPNSPEISRPEKIVILKDGTITLNHSSKVTLGEYKKGELTRAYNSSEYRDLTGGESRECIGCTYIKWCRESEKLRPSSKYHNTGRSDKFYCQKVLELIK